MARVHGNRIITRRTNYSLQRDYRSYKSIIIKDFKNICGYCGKNFGYISCQSQIDHFIPLSFCKENGKDELIYKYENLVYSCSVCNRNKSNDWPSKSFTSHHNNIQGYVDPASSDYDVHLSRDENGSIIANTEVGNYMVSHFKFNVRPIDIIWLVEQLKEKLIVLEKKIERQMDNESYKEFYIISKKLNKSFSTLKEHKEQL